MPGGGLRDAHHAGAARRVDAAHPSRSGSAPPRTASLISDLAIRHREAPQRMRGQIFTTGASLKITGFALGAAVAGPLAGPFQWRHWRSSRSRRLPQTDPHDRSPSDDHAQPSLWAVRHPSRSLLTTPGRRGLGAEGSTTAHVAVMETVAVAAARKYGSHERGGRPRDGKGGRRSRSTCPGESDFAADRLLGGGAPTPYGAGRRVRRRSWDTCGAARHCRAHRTCTRTNISGPTSPVAALLRSVRSVRASPVP